MLMTIKIFGAIVLIPILLYIVLTGLSLIWAALMANDMKNFGAFMWGCVIILVVCSFVSACVCAFVPQCETDCMCRDNGNEKCERDCEDCMATEKIHELNIMLLGGIATIVVIYCLFVHLKLDLKIAKFHMYIGFYLHKGKGQKRWILVEPWIGKYAYLEPEISGINRKGKHYMNNWQVFEYAEEFYERTAIVRAYRGYDDIIDMNGRSVLKIKEEDRSKVSIENIYTYDGDVEKRVKVLRIESSEYLIRRDGTYIWDEPIEWKRSKDAYLFANDYLYKNIISVEVGGQRYRYDIDKDEIIQGWDEDIK